MIDDGGTFREFVRRSSRPAACACTSVPDGGSALDEARAARDAGDPYRIVLLDYGLPAETDWRWPTPCAELRGDDDSTSCCHGVHCDAR
ncbi:MAG: hypothetical protein H6825_04970 [Planctomycetes bacterium]|nr:hypothetical protein [Planctomycetota bacterium]